MKVRQLGPLQVSALGLGCMGMSEFYGPPTAEAQALRTIRQALDLGVTLVDTADIYGPFTNEGLVGKAIRGRRDEVVLCTKFGTFQGDSGRPDAVRRACDESLRRLGIEVIDLYYQFRVDPSVPVEETWGAMVGLVDSGKIRHLGLSEVSPATIRRVHDIHPVAAVQSEFSLWTRDPDLDGVLATTRELGTGFVASSPMGRKLLTGDLRSMDQLDAGDSRRRNPRFQPDTFARNLALVTALQPIADERGVTLAQLALAWVLAAGPHIMAIPGTTRIDHLQENLQAQEITLSDGDLEFLSAHLPYGAAAGDRYSNMSFVGG